MTGPAGTSAASGSIRLSEAAGRVTDYAFRELDWPHLWLSNALDNPGSRRIKEKEGAQLFDLLIGRFVGGESSRMVWLLTWRTGG